MASDGSEYFADKYFADGYWNANYWVDSGTPPSVLAGTDIPILPTVITMPSIARQLNTMMVGWYEKSILQVI